MRFVSVRDLRNTPSEVWSALRTDDLVLTNNGDPVAVLARVQGDDVEATLAALRRVRAEQAVAHLRQQAQASGKSSMSDKEIDAEIRRARRERARR